MTITNSDIAKIHSKMDGWVGNESRNVSVSIGSHLTIDFGKQISVPVTTIRSYLRGEWRLWIQYCCWRIEVRNRVVAGSDDPHDKLERAVAYLSGRRLSGINIKAPAPDVSFQFTDDVALKLFPFNFTSDYVDWYLFTPNHEVIVFATGKPWECVSER